VEQARKGGIAQRGGCLFPERGAVVAPEEGGEGGTSGTS